MPWSLAVRANFEVLREDWWTVVDAAQSVEAVGGEALAVGMVGWCRLNLD